MTLSKMVHALHATEHGLPVFPQSGKRPLIKGWPTNATLKESVIGRWWTRWPDADIGIALPSNVYVLDADTPAALLELRDIVDRTPTLTVQTARGFHAYYLVPHELARMTGDAPAGLRCIEGKGAPGPVTWAGSVHASGHVYTILDDRPIAKMYGKTVQEIGPKRDQTRAGEATDEERVRWRRAYNRVTFPSGLGDMMAPALMREDARADLRGVLRMLRLELPELPTGWADRAFRAAAYLGPHIASGGLGLDDTQEALVELFAEIDTQGGPNEHVLRSIARGLATGARSAEL